jgi:predicted nucleic acid-binding protein
MTHFTVVYDACVLYSAFLRNVFMHLGTAGIFRPKWTATIHEEWMRNLLKNRPDLSREQVTRIRTLMDTHIYDAIVMGYEEIVPQLSLPDQNDNHVLAAAIRSNASVIVTFNLDDFPQSCLAPYEIEAQHPDEFLRHLIDLSRPSVLECMRTMRESLKRPELSSDAFLDRLEKLGLPVSAQALRDYSDFI